MTGAHSGPDKVVAPDERLSWGKTVGLGVQHVVAMFGATFVFPLVMGLHPQLAIMMSGIATIAFLLIVQGKVASYLGTSAAFVGGVAAVRANGGDSQQVTGAILVSGVVLAAVGVAIHFLGSSVLHKVLPPIITGAVVMLIGFNLAPVVAGIYWPQDQWVAIATMLFTIVCATALSGFIGRIAIFLALIFGTVLSWLLDTTVGPITSVLGGATEATSHLRWDTAAMGDAPWFGFPARTMVAADGKEVVGWHTPSFSTAAILLVLPAVIALIAENTGHVKAVTEMTEHNLDPVMAATRVYSTAAYYVAAIVALVFGLSPKFGALVASVPGGVLNGITVVLYGMIGLLGAQIWKENGVDFGNPINRVPVAAGIIIVIGNVKLQITDGFSSRASRSAPSSSSPASTSPGSWLPMSCATGPKAPRSRWVTTSTTTATASTTSTSRATPASAIPIATRARDGGPRMTSPRPGPRHSGRGRSFHGTFEQAGWNR